MTDARRHPSQPPAGVALSGPLRPGYEAVLTPDALAFVADLGADVRPARDASCSRARERQAGSTRASARLPPRDGRHPRRATGPSRRCPRTCSTAASRSPGPIDRKMVINALNSGASVFMADFEDSNSPTWDNLVQGQINLARRGPPDDRVHRARDAARRYALKDKTAVLFVRPRGWHLVEQHMTRRRQARPRRRSSTSASSSSTTRKEQLARGTGPYFYLPKMESHLEARLWNDVFVRAQEKLGLPRGTIKATVPHRDAPAAFEMDEILYELREHSAGLNCGRWDYIFSFIKKRANDPRRVLPDRAQVTMDKGFLARLRRSCSSRPATAAACTRWAAWRRRSRSRTTRPPTRRRSRRCAPTSCAR